MLFGPFACSTNLGVEVNNVQLGIVLLPVHSVLASVAGARAPMGVHLPHLRDGISWMLRKFFSGSKDFFVVFVAGNLEIDLPCLGFFCWLPALNGLIWQVLP